MPDTSYNDDRLEPTAERRKIRKRVRRQDIAAKRRFAAWN